MAMHLGDSGLEDGADAGDGAVRDENLSAAGRVDEDAQRAAVQLMIPLPARRLTFFPACRCAVRAQMSIIRE